MYLIESKRNGEWIYDPGMVMALQDYVKDHIFLDDDVLFAYMMHPAVQIGKFQNAYEEVNQPYMDAHDIKIIRRESGGGAIYLDDRNMSFCFLFDGSTDIYGNYARLYEPVVKALENLGVDHVEHKGRNDLVLDGKKISGSAMTLQKGRVYAGYSLLLDPNYEAIVSVLNPNQKKIKAHGIQSIRSRVGSIRPYLAPEYQEMTVWDFTDYMICQLLGVDDVSEAKRYELTPEDWAGVDKIAAEKYHNWDWNYGRFNQFEYHLTERFPIGTISVGLTVKHAKIASIQITGDFFGSKEIKEVEEALVGVRLRREDLLNALEPLDLANYFGNLSKEELVSFILSEKA
ncbi:lipoate-protein ligase A [Virgibacillus natechei]|uniref:lipoate--protein ligase n=1 Tax=Virgibacillus natechei TaxID=1216297 RepID=A0ABS4IG79_9BACI|nr:lipoate--protein ligase [Virgibacillus natechei]MBP1969955.1 lipoate-protein ligase A [Virgibacillus natechei]UZD13385.1 lipoate--protein ligase [Virgibacillus natechei]